MDPSELPAKSTLTFGKGLLKQGFAGEPNKKPASKLSAPKAAKIAPKTPARPPPGPASDKPKTAMYKAKDPKVLLPHLLSFPATHVSTLEVVLFLLRA